MAYSGSAWGDLVQTDIQLEESKRHGELSRDEQMEIKRQTMDRLAEHNPILRHAMEVKVVMNERRNFLNIMIRKDYLPLIFMRTEPEPSGESDVTYCFFLSDKLEPYVIVTAVHHVHGKIRKLTPAQLKTLREAIHEFKDKFKIENEGYHYTPLQERANTDSFASSSKGVGRANKAHSSHFHLKMRIPTGMLMHLNPINRLLDIEHLRTVLEPVKYNYTRDTVTWEECIKQMKADTE